MTDALQNLWKFCTPSGFPIYILLLLLLTCLIFFNIYKLFLEVFVYMNSQRMLKLKIQIPR